MDFSEFAQRSGSAIKGKSKTSDFARTLLEAILPIKKKDLLDGISENTFKS